MIETFFEIWIGYKRRPEENLNKKLSTNEGVKFMPIKFLEETKIESFTFAGLPAEEKMAKYLAEMIY